MGIEKQTLFLKPDEMKFLALAVLSKLEDLDKSQRNPKLNWNPETRKLLKVMVDAGTALKVKMQKLGCDMRDIPEFEEGDEDEFLTKES